LFGRNWAELVEIFLASFFFCLENWKETFQHFPQPESLACMQHIPGSRPKQIGKRFQALPPTVLDLQEFFKSLLDLFFQMRKTIPPTTYNPYS
jgi:hypothetical protein